ncbi:MAG TPA: plastocyanin/azurin family copper-binding protein [Acidimicrobiales bacterium]
MRASRRRWLPAVAVALAAGTVLGAGQLIGHSAPSSAASDMLGPGDVTVTLTIHHSHFDLSTIHVAPGTTVRFVVDNQDPINHELIVGDAEVQRIHELGTEAVHPPRPGEVSVPALTTAETTFYFADPGSVMYACHLPGHFRYGMSGYVDVGT